jgi:hypothetical protein
VSEFVANDDRLLDLAELICDESASDVELAELDAFLLGDQASRRRYWDYCRINAALRLQLRANRATRAVCQEIGVRAVAPGAPHLDSVVKTEASALPVATLWHGDFGYFSSGWPLAYLLATVIVTGGVLVAAFTHVTQRNPVAVQPPHASDMTAAESQPAVGRITAMVGCKPANMEREVVEGDCALLGSEYSLASGLMEITYNTGARIILQGPVTYRVESRNGGFMPVGKLTGKMATVRAKGFVVRTPTATVTDLGTEFGIEVARSGTTKTQVFQGAVELRINQDGGMASRKVLRPEDGAACVDVSQAEHPGIRHEDAAPDAFVREMPKLRRVPLRVFSTGVGVAEGQPDRHWQIVAASNDPKFRPRPATVTTPCEEWLQNDPGRSQWISAVGDASPLPGNTTYTFRTAFELNDVRMETVRLTGVLMADNRVQAIRLNGHSLPAPEQGERRRDPFELFHRFVLDSGFVAGVNVLEFDVENGYGSSPEPTPMGLRVELHGSARQEYRAPQTVPDGIPQKGG